MSELLNDLERLVRKYEHGSHDERCVASILACVKGSLNGGGIRQLKDMCIEFAQEQLTILREKVKRDSARLN